MHIYFSGIGGHAIGPLAQIAKQAGYEVSGSDKQESLEVQHLREQGITVHIGQTNETIAAAHEAHPIDWLVYSSAVSYENPNHPELVFAQTHDIKFSKRDELLNRIIEDRNLKLVALAGTHGKTTTTAMVVWLFEKLGLPISYSVGAEISFGPMGSFDTASTYFVYECDEFDRNFLAFHPHISGITGIAWDHHEIYPTADDYNQAFRDFIKQTDNTIAWRDDLNAVSLTASADIIALDKHDPTIDSIALKGRFNREDAWLAIQVVHTLTGTPLTELQTHIESFPTPKQRMELLVPNLYTNYAHTPEKIRGGMSTALEIAKQNSQDLVVLYEPLTNRRQHFIKDEYKDVFAGAKKLYWVPTYLAREDPDLPLLTPAELITCISDPSIASPAELNDELLQHIRNHLQNGDLVVAMGAAGGRSMDEWLRNRFVVQ
jgi:UDP-N-acetylmuramate--alanine ligase